MTSQSQQDDGGRLWSTSPPFLHSGPKETTPTRQSSSAHAQEETRQTKNLPTLMEMARAFPNIAQQVCFHPKQLTFYSLVGRVPRSKQKVAQWL